MSESDMHPPDEGNAVLGIACGLLLMAGVVVATAGLYWIAAWVLS